MGSYLNNKEMTSKISKDGKTQDSITIRFKNCRNQSNSNNKGISQKKDKRIIRNNQDQTLKIEKAKANKEILKVEEEVVLIVLITLINQRINPNKELLKTLRVKDSRIKIQILKYQIIIHTLEKKIGINHHKGTPIRIMGKNTNKIIIS